jgi:acyl-CoA synthetase (AMP-forming)/AMP-acid ligase II
MPGVSIRVTGAGGELARGEVGDLEIRGASLFAGYYDPELDGLLDRSAFTPDGWLRTGDSGYLDAEGEVFVLGRTRAMVKQAGALIAPREVEEAVDALEGARLSAAVGLPSPLTGAEELVVVVELRDAPEQLSEEQSERMVMAVRKAVGTQVGVVPGRVLLVPPRTIPLTANGKILHVALRDSLVARGL